MTAPDRIWAVHHETHGAVMIGEWADTIRHLGGTPYLRADLAAAVTAERDALRAEVERLRAEVERLRASEGMARLNGWNSAVERCVYETRPDH